MDVVKTILGQHWPFYSHQKLYDMVRTEAKGPGAVEDAGDAWMEFVTLMAESRQKIEQLLSEAGASWEGVAAEAMRDGVTPLAQWAEDARDASAASGLSVRQLGESFAYTSNAMPEPVAATQTGWSALFTQLFSGQTDQDGNERLAQEAKRRAVELMESYSTNASAAVSSVGTFVPPQSVSVGVAPAQRFGGPVGTAADAIVTAPPSPGGSDGVPVERDGNVTVAPTSGTPGTPGPSTTPTRSSTGQPRHRAGDAAPTTGSFFTPATPVRDVVPTTRDSTTATGFGGAAGTPPASGRPGRASITGQREGRERPGSGRPVSERPAGAHRATTSTGRHAATGVPPFVPPVGLRRGEDDTEHQTPGYLRDFHDEVWEGGQPDVSPPVIGEDPEEG